MVCWSAIEGSAGSDEPPAKKVSSSPEPQRRILEDTIVIVSSWDAVKARMSLLPESYNSGKALRDPISGILRVFVVFAYFSSVLAA